MPEVMVVAAISALVVAAGVAVLSQTGVFERKTIVQTLVDTEFAAGLQLGQNTTRIAPYLGIEAMGDCLRGGNGTGCDAYGAWKDFPDTAGPGEPQFHTRFDQQGPCRPPKPCLAERTMRYHWVCTPTACSALEVEVKVVSHDQNSPKERSTRITIDKRRLVDRGQLRFLCDSMGKSVVGVDYGKLMDICLAEGPSSCDMPNAFFTVGGAPTDCMPNLASGCGGGYSTVGLDAGSEQCAPAP